jgi:hypothetical protein
MSSYSANAIRRSYMDEATKAALLGHSTGTSFGLPMSSFVTFPLSALAKGPVTLVNGAEGMAIMPLQAFAATIAQLPGDILANMGWPAPVGVEDPDGHDEPWLAGATPFWYADNVGSIVLLPNATAQPVPRLWVECVAGRPLAVKADVVAPAEGEPDPLLTIVVFYTLF